MSTFLGWVSSNLILALLNLKMYIYFIPKIPIVETYFVVLFLRKKTFLKIISTTGIYLLFLHR